MGKIRGRHVFNILGSSIVALWIVLLVVLIQKTGFSRPPDAPELEAGEPLPEISSEREWMEIYLKGKKVGYSMSQATALEKGYLIQEEIFLKLNLMGQTNNLRTVTRSVVDRDFRVKNFRFTVSSGVVDFLVSGSFGAEALDIEIGRGERSRKVSIPVDEPPMLAAGIGYFLRGAKMLLGHRFLFPIFDPSTMSNRKMEIRVAAKEQVVINRIGYDAFRLESELYGQAVTFWVDKQGRVLKEEGFMGLTLVRSSGASAPFDIDGRGGDDFYELAAVGLKGRIRSAEKTSFLRLEVEGADKADFDPIMLNRGRQVYNGGILEIRKEEIPAAASFRIPFEGHEDSMKPFLAPEMNMESDDPLVVKKALEIAGKSDDPIVVSSKLMKWVHANMEKRPLVSVPSASDVIRTMTGDCNEHAVLLGALLRAAGIPSRLCVGIVYAREKFFYHAWNECYVGAWISMDATMNQMPADATHIKLIQGGLEEQAKLIGVIGKLSLKVVEYGY